MYYHDYHLIILRQFEECSSTKGIVISTWCIYFLRRLQLRKLHGYKVAWVQVVSQVSARDYASALVLDKLIESELITTIFRTYYFVAYTMTYCEQLSV